MSNADNLYADYLEKDHNAKLFGTLTVISDQLRSMNALLAQLAERLLEVGQMNMLQPVDTATEESQTTPQKPTPEDSLNDLGNS